MEIVLASASPRRRELLEKLGLSFVVDPSDYPEEAFFGLKPHDLVRRISLEKARAVALRHPESLIIAADSLIFFKDKVLGKPRDAEDAARMLKYLGGAWHRGITGFTVLDAGKNKAQSRAVETKIHLRKLSSREINSYVATGEPLDKAGAYAIQGLGAILVDKIEGDYFNVVGLPLSALALTLKRFGVNVL